MRVLNLGAGVGSTTVFMLARLGEIEPLDAAVFADTGEEPRAVYDHLEWLRSLGSPPILTCSAGKLGDDLIAGRNAAGNGRRAGRFTSIPAYTGPQQDHNNLRVVSSCEVGMIPRQCTRDYKVDPVIRVIREQLLGLKPRQRVPKGTRVIQVYGLDADEAGRILRVAARVQDRGWTVADFPLQTLGWSRQDCSSYLAEHVPHPVPRSACTFCPFRSAQEWVWLRDNDPDGWARAVEIDRAMRDGESVCAQQLRKALYLHRSCLPLPLVPLDELAAKEREKERQKNLHRAADCDGCCGV